MPNDLTLLSVIIPARNEQDALPSTVEHLFVELRRNGIPHEIVVVDDGSTAAIELSPHRFVHPIHLITLANNRGCAFARNTGLEQIVAKGFDYVALQDAGDIDIGERMAKQSRFLDLNPDIAVVGAWGEYVNMDGELLYVHKPPSLSREIRARMPFSSAFIHPACMMRVSALKTVGFYDTSYPNSSDYELLFRLTRRFESANLPEILIKKENNPASLSLGKRRRGLKYRLRAQLTYFRFQSPRSYLGVMTTLAFFLIPYRIILAIKERRVYAG